MAAARGRSPRLTVGAATATLLPMRRGRRTRISPSEAAVPRASSAARDDEELVALAREARRRAHRPSSGLRVAAAARDVEGRVFTGCNVENASFGLTLCAERVAVVK